jgi:excisionase family DNA binding protein
MLDIDVPEYVTINECAVILNVNPITIRRWGKNNKINMQRFGGLYLIPKKEVERLRSANINPQLLIQPPDF